MKKYQLNLKRIQNRVLSNTVALPDYNVTKTQNRRCWLTWAKPKSKCDFINYFWVAKTQLALFLVTTAAYQGTINFSTTAGMRLNHHGKLWSSTFLTFWINQKRRLYPTFYSSLQTGWGAAELPGKCSPKNFWKHVYLLGTTQVAIILLPPENSTTVTHFFVCYLNY